MPGIARRIELDPLTGGIGAVVHGVDLASPLDDFLAAELTAAIQRHRVIFLRGQHRLEDDGQVALAERIGGTTRTHHPLSPGHHADKRISRLDSVRMAEENGRTDHWHVDSTFVERPPGGAVLRAVQLPPTGGDTLWANTVAAYATLPDPLRAFADAAWAVHSNRWGYAHIWTAARELPPPPEAGPDAATGFAGAPFETIHPLVRVHPQTGERALLLGSHLRHILGLTPAASTALRQVLQDHITRPENTVRWRWAQGDVAIWDNRSSQHYASADYVGHRIMHRVFLAGETPVGIDGTPSRAVVGDDGGFAPVARAAAAD
jgi:taurine dioxygenase